MLRPSSQDKPLLIALLAIALGLGLNAAVSFAEQPNQSPNHYTDKKPDYVPEWLWGAAEALATGAIALYAIRQFGDSRRTTERQFRAYVLNSNASLLDGSSLKNTPVDRKGQVGGSLGIKNYGNTPAYKLRHAAYLKVAPVTEEHKMSVPPGISMDSAFIIAPGDVATANRWLGRAITEEERHGILIGTHAIYGYGRVEYTDAFKRARWATYRLRYCGSAWPPATKSVAMNFCGGGCDAN